MFCVEKANLHCRTDCIAIICANETNETKMVREKGIIAKSRDNSDTRVRYDLRRLGV